MLVNERNVYLKGRLWMNEATFALNWTINFKQLSLIIRHLKIQAAPVGLENMTSALLAGAMLYELSYEAIQLGAG